MAETIVSAAPVDPDPKPGESIHVDDFGALVGEIQEAEGVGYMEAVGIAQQVADALVAFMVAWDGSVFWQGNDDARPRCPLP